jgi:2-oxo-4-hydroxy-4-carboxy--5-ureidoimidazoline (OHCU) decarboxylase
VNKMVTGKTSAELLAEFTRRMDQSSQKAGSVEFAQAFDEVHRQGQERLPWR